MYSILGKFQLTWWIKKYHDKKFNCECNEQSICFLSYKFVYLKQSNCWNLSNMKFPYTKTWVLTKYWMQLYVFEYCNMTNVKRKRRKWKF